MHDAAERATSNPPKDQIVSDIISLWHGGRTLPEIAGRLHLKDSFVRHVLQHDTLPAKHLPLLWRDESEMQR